MVMVQKIPMGYDDEEDDDTTVVSESDGKCGARRQETIFVYERVMAGTN